MQKNSFPAKCDCSVIHEATVEKVRRAMPSIEILYEAADLFKVLGDGTRIRILSALCRSELCGCDICALLDMTQSAVSHQLRVLKQARLVQHRREGKIVYFRLDDSHIGELLDLGTAHAGENEVQFTKDAQ